MMELAAARARADEAKTAAAAATKAAIAADELHAEAERHVASLEGTLFPSRTVNDNGPTHAENEWSFLTHTREMTRVMRRRKVALGTRTVAPSPRDGKDGYLEHPRLGLLGAVRYWARGVVTTAVMMIVAMISPSSSPSNNPHVVLVVFIFL